MLKQVTVFDPDIFKRGTPIKVHFDGNEALDFFALVESVNADDLHLLTVLSPGNNVYSYYKEELRWWKEEGHKREVTVKVEAVINNKVEILLLENAFNIKGI